MSLKEVKPLIAALKNPDDDALDSILDQIKVSKKISSDFLYNEELSSAFREALHKIGGKIPEDDDADETTDSVYELMYELYSKSNVKGKRFVLQFVPLLISFYLEYRDNVRPGIEAVLVGIYNEEMIARHGTELKWKPPKASISSVYRRKDKGLETKRKGPISNSNNGALTPNSLKVLDTQAAPQRKFLLLEEILAPLHNLGSQERDKVVRIALQHFNAHSPFLPLSAVVDFCDLCVKLCLRGLPHSIAAQGENGKAEINGVIRTDITLQYSPRVVLSPEVMQEFINGITVALFKKENTRPYALKALNALHQRAAYELVHSILISTNALLHILESEKKKETTSPSIPPSETVKLVQLEEKQQQEEKRLQEQKRELAEKELAERAMQKKEELKDSRSKISKISLKESEEVTSSSEDSEKEEPEAGFNTRSSTEKEKKKLEKESQKELKKLAKKEKKEKKKHIKEDKKTLHEDPNHDPEFSY